MITVTLNGGLANQMFQYAFGKSLSKARDTAVYFRKGFLGGETRAHIQFSLHAYDVDVEFNNQIESVYTEPDMTFNPDVYRVSSGTLMNGVWQSEKYFENVADTIRETFRRPRGYEGEQNTYYAARIQSGPSAFIHVRRGDYLEQGLNFHGTIHPDYYREGIKRIRSKTPHTTFFVFSDDLEWCKENFDGDCIMVEGNGDWRLAQWDIWLMSLCNVGGIIANSSFGWWGAWLGETNRRYAGEIVAPRPWFIPQFPTTKDIIPDRWTILYSGQLPEPPQIKRKVRIRRTARPGEKLGPGPEYIEVEV